jgi:hypothetical protein
LHNIRLSHNANRQPILLSSRRAATHLPTAAADARASNRPFNQLQVMPEKRSLHPNLPQTATYRTQSLICNTQPLQAEASCHPDGGLPICSHCHCHPRMASRGKRNGTQVLKGADGRREPEGSWLLHSSSAPPTHVVQLAAQCMG